MLDTLLQLLCLAVWLLTVSFVHRQSRQIYALRARLLSYVESRDRIANEYQRTVKQLLDCARGVNKALHDHDKRLRTIVGRQDQMSLQEQHASPPRYREAADMLRRGADEDELMGACGLSRGEAHLIAHLERLQNRVT